MIIVYSITATAITRANRPNPLDATTRPAPDELPDPAVGVADELVGAAVAFAPTPPFTLPVAVTYLKASVNRYSSKSSSLTVGSDWPMAKAAAWKAL